MRVNRKPTGTATSVPAGLAWGLLISATTTLLGCLLTAKLINDEILSWNHCGYGVLVILILSAWGGAMVSAARIKRRRLMVCLASGSLYFLLLMAAAALFFGGRYSGVGETVLLIFCGSMLGFLSGIPGKSRRNHSKFKTHNR